MGAGLARASPFVVLELRMDWKSFLTRCWCWVFPMLGWKSRLSAYVGGKAVWPVEGRPDMPALSPWPAEWCVAEVVEATAAEPQAHMKLVSATSLISGILAEGEDAVRCCRCGIPLHVTEAHMHTSIDVPSCSWCLGSVMRAR